jgi:glucose/arabinose dehydrogenase
VRIVVAAGALAIASSAAAATLPTGFAETQIVAGIGSPTAMALAPDGRIFVCEQGGRLRVIKNGAVLPTPFLTLPVNSLGERGLLGVTFDPAFATNHYVYVYYTATTPTIHNRVSRFTASGDVAVSGSETVLLDLNPLSSATNHNGGALHFGRDGKLYIAVGENANGANAQTLENLLGKLLRINKDGTIPSDNPFFGTATGTNRAIWALGLRNPYTFAVHRTTGRMFINDVGQDAWEEINDGIRGSNYGWPTTEGHTTDPRFRDPLYVYGHGTGCAITGGTFYDPPTGQFPPAYANTYFFADFCSGWIHRYNPANGAVSGFATGIASPVDLRVAADGSLYYLARGAGAVFRVRYTASQAPTITTQPANARVSVGQPATFAVTASGTAPLSYQWQRNGADIAGAISRTYTLATTTLADDGARFRVLVSNAYGNVTSEEATLDVTSNSAPVATITAPAHRMFYSAGDTIGFAGTGTDAEDGTLPASAFTWVVEFHHDTHTHPFMPPTGGTKAGAFSIPTTGETSPNVWYRILLTVRDSGGLTDTTFVDVVPRTVTFTLATTPGGLQVTLDGQPKTTPLSVTGVMGMSRTLGVLSQTVGGVTYEFASWSDGGTAVHSIRTPAINTTYTATYRVQPARAGIGLVGTYYDNPDFTGRAVTRRDPKVLFNWSTGSPAPGIASDTFSVRWRGQVQARVTGTHTFYVRSDGGVRLWVDGQLLIDNWTEHPAVEDSGTVALIAGQKYKLRLDYYDGLGAALAQLSWSAPGIVKEVVPTSALFPYALLVANSTTIGGPDAAVKARLSGTGFVPLVQAASATTSDQATGCAIVVISSSVAPADVGTKFRDTLTPVLAWDSYLYDDLGMTGPLPGTDLGTVTGRQLVIAKPHPMAAGLTGTVTVVKTAAAVFSWGRPAASAVIVARTPGTDPRTAIFGYEKGAPMVGLTAPGRRVGFYLENATASALTLEGWALFDAAVRWATGR